MRKLVLPNIELELELELELDIELDLELDLDLDLLIYRINGLSLIRSSLLLIDL